MSFHPAYLQPFFTVEHRDSRMMPDEEARCRMVLRGWEMESAFVWVKTLMSWRVSCLPSLSLVGSDYVG